MSWFSVGRSEMFPSNYGHNLTPASVDVLVAGLILAFVILATAGAAILPAYGAGRRWVTLGAYGFASLLIGGIILVCNFGHEWETGHVEMGSPYKGGSAVEMVGELGLHVALRGINITLRGDLRHDATATENQTMTTHPASENEVINYNEHFSWEGSQGRFGFGPYAGRISRDYRASVVRGSPIPILVTAEYFTFDGEGLRFGRHYRLAGYYASFFMWVAFTTWLLANVGFFMVVRLGAVFLTATGVSQAIAILLWSCIRNSIEISIPFESADGSHDVLLTTRYGPDYWLVLVNGVLCTVGGLVIFVADDFYKEKLCALFGIDPLSLYTYVYKEVPDESSDGDGLDNLGFDHGMKLSQLRYIQEDEIRKGNDDDDEDDDGLDLGAIREEAEGDENEGENENEIERRTNPEVVRRRPRRPTRDTQNSQTRHRLSTAPKLGSQSRTSSVLRLSSRQSTIGAGAGADHDRDRVPIIIQERRMTARRSIYNPFNRKSRMSHTGTGWEHAHPHACARSPMPSTISATAPAFMSAPTSMSISGPRTSTLLKNGRPLTSSEA